ncbi:MAG: mycothiol-dependent nitroreductase Rv2466c family protein [Canibacter sp.]
MVENVNPKSVEFWFDPVCPWCWMTSRWITEVAAVRGFNIEWHPFSLAILNKDRDMSDRHRDGHARGLRALRVIEQARQEHGEDVVGKLYTEIGTRIHPGAREDIDDIIAESLESVGLSSELSVAADPESADHPEDGLYNELNASTERALDLVGKDVGIPIIAIDGVAFFGPVVTPAPTGDAALRLFDGVVAAASVDGFYELKRSRNVGPQF